MAVYIPNVEHGKQIFDDIDKVNGRNIDYNNIGLIVPYTWEDFADLVQYERDESIAPHYSAMLATNLMKGKFKQKFMHFKDISYVEEPEALQVFWTNNYIQILNKIPTWDISTGNYFDKYYELYINDAIRSTADEINCTINIPTVTTVVKNNQKKHIVSRTAAVSLSIPDVGEDDEYSMQDKLVYKALTSSCAEEALNLDSYSSPDLIYEKKETIELRRTSGFYKVLSDIDKECEDNNSKIIINKPIANTFVFMEKFMDGDIKEDAYLSEKITPILSKLFSDSIIQKEIPDEYIDDKSDYEEDYEM